MLKVLFFFLVYFISADLLAQELVLLEERGLLAYSDTSPANLLPYSARHYEVVAAFDRPVPPFLGRGYWAAVTDTGGEAELILQSEAGHYEMTAPWTEEWQQVLKLISGE